MHEAGALVCGASVAAAARRLARRRGARVQRGRRPAPRDARARERVLRVRRPAVAIAWLLAAGRRTGRLRRRRRAPRRRPAGDLLGRPARADGLDARVRAAVLLPGDRRHAGARRARARRGARSTCRCRRGTGDDAWLDAFRAIVPRAVGEFAPDVLVTQLGCDTHHTDPLAQLRLTTRAYREAAAELHELAHERGRRPMGRDRRRRLPVGARRAAGVDDRVRRDGGRPRTCPTSSRPPGSSRRERARRRAGAHHVLGARARAVHAADDEAARGRRPRSSDIVWG